MHRRCPVAGVKTCRDDSAGVLPRTTTQGDLARDSPETALHVTSRHLMTRPLNSAFTSAVVWGHEVLRGVVNSPSINGMQGVRGSNPLSSTTTSQQVTAPHFIQRRF